MPPVDPTYPLYPIACILSSMLLLLTLANSLIRQKWNLGVVFLCFWTFWDNIALGVNAVVWSDNYDIKLYVYCDIVSRLQLITYVVKPMCTLIIIRRLHLIAGLRSVELPSAREKYKNVAIEWTLGLIIPLIVAGPLYYVVQASRFQVLEGFGCQNAPDSSILASLLINSWYVLPPLISVLVYYPKVVWVFYRQRRDINHFLLSNNSISHTSYFRLMTLASIDLLFTLPTGISSLVIHYIGASKQNDNHISFSKGAGFIHSDWAPVGYNFTHIKSEGAATLPRLYIIPWTTPALGLIVFGLFGLTVEARAGYWHTVCSVGQWFGWKPASPQAKETYALGAKKPYVHPQEISLDAELGSRPSFVNFEPDITLSPVGAEATRINVLESSVSDDLSHKSSLGSATDLQPANNTAENASSLNEHTL